MKLALGMIVGSQPEPFLETVLSVMDSYFVGKVIRRETKEWSDSYAQARNEVIEQAEKEGYDAIIMIDADECMMGLDLLRVREYLEDVDVVGLPEIEMAKDFEHFESYLYPDMHYRAFRLNRGLRYQLDIHEALNIREDTPYMVAVNCPIFHYGKCKPASLLIKKFQHYAQMQGQPLPPDDTTQFWTKLDIWHGDHPLKFYELEDIVK